MHQSRYPVKSKDPTQNPTNMGASISNECCDTDSNEPFDFLLNPICIVVVLLSYSVLFYILVIHYTNKIKFKPNNESTTT